MYAYRYIIVNKHKNHFSLADKPTNMYNSVQG